MRARKPSSSGPQESTGPTEPRLVSVFPGSDGVPALTAEASALEQLCLRATGGLTAIPGRGLEVGGLLVGNWDSDAAALPASARNSSDATAPDFPAMPIVQRRLRASLHDCPAVEITYESGPRFVATEGDLAKLRDVIQDQRKSGQQVIGWWRSHTLNDDLGFSTEDLALSRNLFGSDPALTLLLLPKRGDAPLATLHAVVADEIHSSSCFPLVGEPMRPTEPVTTELPVLADIEDTLNARAASNPEAPPESHAAPPPPRRLLPPAAGSGEEWRSRSYLHRAPVWQGRLHKLNTLASTRRGVFQLAGIGFMGVFLIAAVAYVVVGAQRSGQSDPETAASASADGSSKSATSLVLSARQADGGVYLEWDRDLDLVQQASDGLLVIEDAGQRKEIVLSPATLKTGRVVWFPNADAVGFLLTIRGDRMVGSGQLQVYGLTPSAVAKETPSVASGLSLHAPVTLDRKNAAGIDAPRGGAFREAARRPVNQSRQEVRPASSLGSAAGTHSTTAPASASVASPDAASPDAAVPLNRPSPLPETASGSRIGTQGEPFPDSPTCRVTLATISYRDKRSRLGLLGALRKLPFIPDGKGAPSPDFSAAYTVKASCPKLTITSLRTQPQWVDIIAEIDTGGDVRKAKPSDSKEGSYVAARTMESVRQWRFSPAKLANSPVDSEVRLRVHWSYPQPAAVSPVRAQ